MAPVPFTLGQGTGWPTFRKAPCRDQRPRPQPQTSAVRNSLLADGTVLLYLSPHRLLCASAKNLPVISKLRQEVPPVLSAVNKRLPHHKNDLKRTKVCSGGLLPGKDRERSSGTGGDRRVQGALLPAGRGSKYGVSSRRATASPPLASPISAERPAPQRGNSQSEQGAQSSPAQPFTSRGARWFSTLGKVPG